MLVVTGKTFITQQDGTSKNVVEIRCDTADDLPSPPPAGWLVGSVAWIVGTGELYGLNSAGEWILQE